jgi:hypothetical protein
MNKPQKFVILAWASISLGCCAVLFDSGPTKEGLKVVFEAFGLFSFFCLGMVWVFSEKKDRI